MSSSSWLFTKESLPPRSESVTLQKRAEEVAAEQFERAEKRRVALAELSSEISSASARISAWEKLYGLRLPSDSEHVVLTVIARSTGLTLAEIRNEQRLRNERSRPA